MIVLPDVVKRLSATKVNKFITCPRQFFFEHVLGLSQKIKSYHLPIGEVIHQCAEQLGESRKRRVIGQEFETKHDPYEVSKKDILGKIPLRYGYSHKAVAKAIGTARKQYYDLVIKPRKGIDWSPGNKDYESIVQSILEYQQFWKNDDFEVVFQEILFKVYIHTALPPLWGRIDKLILDKNGNYWVMDHKTGSTLSDRWKAQWTNSFQMNLYSHAANTALVDQVKGFIIDGIFFQKGKRKFERVRVSKTSRDMLGWMYEAQHYLRQIDNGFKFLETTDPEELMNLEYLNNYPRNSNACGNYYGCPFYSYCVSDPNPAHYLVESEYPGEFRVEHWDPSASVHTDRIGI